jgi:hypothetical protein
MAEPENRLVLLAWLNCSRACAPMKGFGENGPVVFITLSKRVLEMVEV